MSLVIPLRGFLSHLWFCIYLSLQSHRWNISPGKHVGRTPVQAAPEAPSLGVRALLCMPVIPVLASLGSWSHWAGTVQLLGWASPKWTTGTLKAGTASYPSLYPCSGHGAWYWCGQWCSETKKNKAWWAPHFICLQHLLSVSSLHGTTQVISSFVS